MGRSRTTRSAKARGSSQPSPGSSTSLRDYFTSADMLLAGKDKMALPRLSAALLLTSRVGLGPLRPPYARPGKQTPTYFDGNGEFLYLGYFHHGCTAWNTGCIISSGPSILYVVHGCLPAPAADGLRSLLAGGKLRIPRALGLLHRLSWPIWYAISSLPYAKDWAYTECSLPPSLHICTCLLQISKAAPLKGPQLLQRCCRHFYAQAVCSPAISHKPGGVPIHLPPLVHMLQSGMSLGIHPSCLCPSSNLRSLWGHFNYPPPLISLHSSQYLPLHQMPSSLHSYL